MKLNDNKQLVKLFYVFEEKRIKKFYEKLYAKWKRLVVILLCSIMFGFGIMIAISGIHYAKAGNHKGKYAIKTSNVKMKSNAEGEKVIKTITIKMPRQYVDKFAFEYQSEDFSNFQYRSRIKRIYMV